MFLCIDNPFTPKFLKLTLLTINFDMSTVANGAPLQKTKTRMANSVHPDETALSEPSHLDLHCLQR